MAKALYRLNLVNLEVSGLSPHTSGMGWDEVSLSLMKQSFKKTRKTKLF